MVGPADGGQCVVDAGAGLRTPGREVAEVAQDKRAEFGVARLVSGLSSGLVVRAGGVVVAEIEREPAGFLCFVTASRFLPFGLVTCWFRFALGGVAFIGSLPDRPPESAQRRTQTTNRSTRCALNDPRRFKTIATSRLAAQHDEIQRLRAAARPRTDNVRNLPRRRSTSPSPIIGPC